MDKQRILALLIILLSFIVAFWLYPILPYPMPSHWNIKGEVDGYMPKLFALFLIPVISLFCFALFVKLPDLDPKKQNIESFKKYYDTFILVFILFFFYLYALMILYSLNPVFNMGFMLIPAFAFLFFYVGILCEHAKQNWFIGIRTPWTLSNETVWNKTNRLGGKIFILVGILLIVCIVLPPAIFWGLFIVGIAITVIVPMVYSFVLYKKIEKK